MIQVQSYLDIADNSGARRVMAGEFFGIWQIFAFLKAIQNIFSLRFSSFFKSGELILNFAN